MKIILTIGLDTDTHSLELGGPLHDPMLFYGMIGSALQQYMTNQKEIQENMKEKKPPLVTPTAVMPKNPLKHL